MPSEQPPTRVEEAARALDKVIWLTDDVPHEVLVPARELHEALLNEPDKPALAQPQPRGEGDAEKTRGYTREDIQANTWWPGKGGEGDDLAARLEEKSNVEEGLRPARPTNLPGPDLYHLGRAEAFAEAAQLARASTHREQANGLKQLYEVDGIFLGKCKNITLYQCENVAINSSANVNIGDCMIEHLTHNNIEHEQDNLHKSPAPEGEGEAG